jgi:hypothetical protein
MEIIALLIAFLVPIGVAIWTVRSSAKDTAQQIAALNESTQKQVESVKELARLQIEISTLQLSKELSDARNQYLKTSQKSMNQYESRNAMAGALYNELTSMMYERREKANDLSAEQDYCTKRINMLNSYMERMNAIKDKLEKK